MNLTNFLRDAYAKSYNIDYDDYAKHRFCDEDALAAQIENESFLSACEDEINRTYIPEYERRTI